MTTPNPLKGTLRVVFKTMMRKRIGDNSNSHPCHLSRKTGGAWGRMVSETCKPNDGLSDEKNNMGLTISPLKGEGRFQTDFAAPNPD